MIPLLRTLNYSHKPEASLRPNCKLQFERKKNAKVIVIMLVGDELAGTSDGDGMALMVVVSEVFVLINAIGDKMSR